MENNKKQSELGDLYSQKEQINPHKSHMESLFPPEGCINFGYWERASNPITKEERLVSQRKLYEKVFSKIRRIQEKKILEVGCGRGYALGWLAKTGAQVFGLDAFEEHVEFSKKNNSALSESIVHGFAEEIPFPESFFDAIYTVEAAQHFESFSRFAKSARKVLKTGGDLVISTYFFNNEESKKEVVKLIPVFIEGTHNAISIKLAENILIQNNFDILEVDKIGEKVFPSYAAWQKQIIEENKKFHIPQENPQWESYYTGGGEGKHPWLICYENGWVDYLILVARKKK